MPTIFSHAVTLRPITDSDLPFLFELYASTREEELKQVDWSAEQKDAFLRQQFGAQHTWWQTHYTGARFDLVLVDGAPAGRLYVDVWPREVRIVDIALMPAYRNGGLGTRLLRQVFEEGDAAGKPVSIHVEVFNPARRLYERLGFVEKGMHGNVYILMERPAGGAAPAEAAA
jgi:ribosomal protein S18 acetylase RimI-like enzyme